MRLAIVMVTACGSAAPKPPPVACDRKPAGDPSMMKTPAGGAIDAPITCKDGAYIRVRGSGMKEVQLGRPALACRQPGSRCILADDFAGPVIERLGKQGIENAGFGLGACGSVDGDYATWNTSIVLHDWAHADAAIAAVAAEITEQDVGNYFGVSIAVKRCYQLESKPK